MQSGNDIWPVYAILQKKNFLSKNSTENVTWKLVSAPF